jgi:hypothetical protein
MSSPLVTLDAVAPAIVGGLIGAAAVVLGVYLTNVFEAGRERKRGIQESALRLRNALQLSSFAIFDPAGRREAVADAQLWDRRFADTQDLIGELLVRCRGKRRRQRRRRERVDRLNVLFSAGVKTIETGRTPSQGEMVVLAEALRDLNELLFGHAGAALPTRLDEFETDVIYFRDQGLDAPSPPSGAAGRPSGVAP